eukprot:2740930-Rhodomonas_salina.2
MGGTSRSTLPVSIGCARTKNGIRFAMPDRTFAGLQVWLQSAGIIDDEFKVPKKVRLLGRPRCSCHQGMLNVVRRVASEREERCTARLSRVS